MTVFGLWLGFKANRANKQRRAVAAIEALGGSVGYDYVPLAPNVEQGYYSGQRSDSPPPRRLVRLFGKHYFVKVVAVHFVRCPNLRDEDLGCLVGLPDIKTLELQGTKLTDAGLEKLRHLRSLSSLNLKDTRVSGRGLAQLNGWVRLSYLGLMGGQVDDGGLEQVGKFSPFNRHLLQVPADHLAYHREVIGPLDRLYLKAPVIVLYEFPILEHDKRTDRFRAGDVRDVYSSGPLRDCPEIEEFL